MVLVDADSEAMVFAETDSSWVAFGVKVCRGIMLFIFSSQVGSIL